MGPVAEVETLGKRTDHILDGPLRVVELAGDLGRVEALGQQPQDVGLPRRQAGTAQAVRGKHLVLDSPEVAYEPGNQTRRQDDVAGQYRPDRAGEPLRSRCL